MTTSPAPIRRSRLLALALLSVAVGCAGGGDLSESEQPTHYVRVTGIVRDVSGEPVPRVSAQLGPDSGFSFARQTTNDEGQYSLTSAARFTVDSLAPDSTTLKLRFFPTEGRHRDSLLLQLSVRVRVVPVSQPEEPAVRNVTVTLP